MSETAYNTGFFACQFLNTFDIFFPLNHKLKHKVPSKNSALIAKTSRAEI